MNIIKVDDDVLAFLKKNAQVFVETPNDVLRRLLLNRGARRNGTKRGSYNRTPADKLIRQEEMMKPIVAILQQEADGRANSKDILEKLKAFFPSRMQYTDDKRFSSNANNARNRLIMEGTITSESRGIWQLTNKGKALKIKDNIKKKVPK